MRKNLVKEVNQGFCTENTERRTEWSGVEWSKSHRKGATGNTGSRTKNPTKRKNNEA